MTFLGKLINLSPYDIGSGHSTFAGTCSTDLLSISGQKHDLSFGMLKEKSLLVQNIVAQCTRLTQVSGCL